MTSPQEAASTKPFAGRVCVGTCSWADKSLDGVFYPDGMKPAERITFYASRFPTVEINSSFYAMPSERNSELWAERTPPGFLFHAKAFGPMTTHKREWQGREMKAATPEMLAAWQAAIAPLKQAGKYGYTLFQFPRWFKPTQANRDYIEWCAGNLPGETIAVEFRNGYWLDDRRRSHTLDWLESLDIAFVCVDEPQTGPAASAPPVTAATRRDLAILRLHGRNTENWTKPGVGVEERFDWDYSAAELEGEIAPRVLELSAAADTTFVMFNNVHGGYGVANALMLLDLMRGRQQA